jgi:phosphate transport system substrate-binding protein
LNLATIAARAARYLMYVAIQASLLRAQKADLPVYKPVPDAFGTIRVCGSPQMANLLRLYEQGFIDLQPAVTFDIQLKSTATAVECISRGDADIALLGREIWPSEIRAFQSAAAHPLLVIDIATGSYDVPKATFALMIFVPKANPLASVSIEQLERIFSSCDDAIRFWGDLGLKGDWATRPIHLYGFTTANDKSRIFSQLVFTKGDSWNTGLIQLADSDGPNGKDAGELVVQGVAKDSEGIGISNVRYATSDVKMLAISTSNQKAPIMPTRQNVANRSYPLTRAVYMVANPSGTHPLSTAALEFLRYVLSSQGARAVIRERTYLPLPPEIALRQLQQLSETSK